MNNKKRKRSKILKNAEMKRQMEKSPAPPAPGPGSQKLSSPGLTDEFQSYKSRLEIEYHLQKISDAIAEEVKRLSLRAQQKGLPADPVAGANSPSDQGPQPGLPDMISKQEAALMLGVHVRTIDNYVRQGILEAKLLPSRQKRFLRKDVRKLLTDRKEKNKE